MQVFCQFGGEPAHTLSHALELPVWQDHLRRLGADLRVIGAYSQLDQRRTFVRQQGWQRRSPGA